MNPRPWKLLLVEDLPIYVSVITNLLINSGIVLDTAQNLSEGIQKAKENSYNAVLLDLGLPDSRGLDTFISFKKACKCLPVIIFSGTDDEAVAIQAMQNGAQDYLVKGSYLTNEQGAKLLLNRSIAYAIERYQIQEELLEERNLLEARVEARTKDLKEANIKLQKVASSLVYAQEDERKRISMILHDEAGQFMIALKLSLNLIQKELQGINEELSGQVYEANQLTDSIIAKLRTLAHELRPPAIDAVGLNQALQDYCRKITRQTDLEINYQGSNASELPNHIQVSLYRVVQEALTNVVKHAHATQVCVVFGVDAEQISLEVFDNGCGFSRTENSLNTSIKGIGLIGIQDRIEAIGGKLIIESNQDEGTRLVISIPLKEYA